METSKKTNVCVRGRCPFITPTFYVDVAADTIVIVDSATVVQATSLCIYIYI